MPRIGVEPTRLSTLAPETSASTISPPGPLVQWVQRYNLFLNLQNIGNFFFDYLHRHTPRCLRRGIGTPTGQASKCDSRRRSGPSGRSFDKGSLCPDRQTNADRKWADATALRAAVSAGLWMPARAFLAIPPLSSTTAVCRRAPHGLSPRCVGARACGRPRAPRRECAPCP